MCFRYCCWIDSSCLGALDSLYQKGTLEEHWRRRRLRDHEEFNDDIAGRNTGRMRSNVKPEDDTTKDDAFLDVLEAMELASMVWRETFDRIALRLETLDRASEIALTEAKQKTREAVENLERIRERATVLPDGRRVYRDQNGHAYTEDGARLSDTEATGIQWAEGSPSREEYDQGNRQHEEARRREEEIERYRERLAEARRRFQDMTPGNTSQEQLEDFESELERDLPATVKNAAENVRIERPQQAAGPEAPAPTVTRPNAAELDATTGTVMPKVALPTPA